MSTATASRAPSRLVLFAVAAVGVSAIITQLVLLRELLGALAGNELVLGVVLGNWLLLTGLGASAGRWAVRVRQPERWFVLLQTAVALLPIGQLVALRVLRDLVFVRGSLVGLTETVLASLVLLLPYCLVSGFLLTLACVIAAARREARPPPRTAPSPNVEGAPNLSRQADSPDTARGVGRVYIADGLGCVLGGLLFCFLLVRTFDHCQLLVLPALLNLLLAGCVAQRAGWRCWWPVPVVLAAALVASVLLLNPDARLTARQFPGQQLLFRGHSPYGRLVVTESAGQLTFHENGVPLFSTRQIDQIEETVHFALAQRPAGRRVLLIGGGMAGTALEVLKHQPESVTYVELDPLILTAGQQFVPENLADPRIRSGLVSTDGRRFVRTTADRFDVVILDLPDPVTLQLNRLYTVEFFRELRRVLAPDGVFAFGLGRYENYLSPELERLLACGGATARAVFPHVLVLPGTRVWFLASAGNLTTDIAGRLEARHIPTRFVHRNALRAILTPDRLGAVQAAAAGPADLNTDVHPRLLARRLEHWVMEFSPRHAVIALLAVALPALLLIRWRAVPLAILAGGFTGAALLVVLLLVFQVLYGSLYYQLGIIITVYMGGLAAGAWLANRPGEVNRRSLLWVVAGLILLAAVLPAALSLVARAGGGLWGRVVIGVLTFLLAALDGAEFPLASRTTGAGAGITAARLYAADFAGGCLGALLVSAALLPLGGVEVTCAVVAGINVLAAVGLVLGSRHG
ncbi:fused MFS/spermidine synthase [bacterium]|nr:fused MFS/spermidine synthase [bacterium]